jgi:hypothetical protein
MTGMNPKPHALQKAAAGFDSLPFIGAAVVTDRRIRRYYR